MSEPRGLIDLASERLGGRAVWANDEFFAPKEHLLKPEPPEFIEGKYTDRGKWMDGWETRRRREPGYDGCIVRLGVPGVVKRIVVDTTHFRGNHPEACSVHVAEARGDLSGEELAGEGTEWREILPLAPLRGNSANEFPIDDEGRCTHVRLNIHPDGGVARLRVYGEARPDWEAILAGSESPDLASVVHGGTVVACSDEFFGEPLNLLMPVEGRSMADGWETRRRRGPGHDWVVIRLGRRGTLERVEVDTRFFKGNFPESCSLEGCDAPAGVVDSSLAGDEPEALSGAEWKGIVARTKLGPDAVHAFDDLLSAGPFTHVRFRIYPDGGVSRLHLHGRPVD